ncbi:hypothetical protein VTL71DRAFT_16473 [Oculimacula yallundae]|uniref:GST C-terminal domain-containing protein n=1 Tax=Oculimacula yallundae TaxID=86028 RepID=A0ABR4CEJ8_9HELO
MSSKPNPKQETIPTIYNMSSSGGLTCLWALEEIHAQYNVVNLARRDPQTAIFLASIYPISKSPIMTLSAINSSPSALAAASVVHQAVPGILTETRLIVQYISDYYSTGEWIPDNEEDLRRDAFFSELIKVSLATKVHYCVMLEVLASLLPWGIRHVVSLLFSPLVKHFVRDQDQIYGIMENALTEEKPWWSGRKLGLADFNALFTLDMAVQRGYLDEGRFPRIKEWYVRVTGREAYRRALEKNGFYDTKNFA